MFCVNITDDTEWMVMLLPHSCSLFSFHPPNRRSFWEPHPARTIFRPVCWLRPQLQAGWFWVVRPIFSSVISQKLLRGNYLQIWHKRAFGRRDKVIRTWWSNVAVTLLFVPWLWLWYLSHAWGIFSIFLIIFYFLSARMRPSTSYWRISSPLFFFFCMLIWICFF